MRIKRIVVIEGPDQSGMNWTAQCLAFIAAHDLVRHPVKVKVPTEIDQSSVDWGGGDIGEVIQFHLMPECLVAEMELDETNPLMEGLVFVLKEHVFYLTVRPADMDIVTRNLSRAIPHCVIVAPTNFKHPRWSLYEKYEEG